MAQRACPATARTERTRASILETAEAIFAERGFDATRLEDMARAGHDRRRHQAEPGSLSEMGRHSPPTGGLHA
jgi:hypothetical protein